MGDLNLNNWDQCIQLICHIILRILCLCILVVLRFQISFHYLEEFWSIQLIQLCLVHPWLFLPWFQTECSVWIEYIHYAIAEARPVGVAIGVVLDTLDNLVSILNDRIIHFFIADHHLAFVCFNFIFSTYNRKWIDDLLLPVDQIVGKGNHFINVCINAAANQIF